MLFNSIPPLLLYFSVSVTVFENMDKAVESCAQTSSSRSGGTLLAKQLLALVKLNFLLAYFVSSHLFSVYFY